MSEPKVIVLHFRTNDMDHLPRIDVIENLNITISNYSAKFPKAKITVSSTLPRRDISNHDENQINRFLSKELLHLPNVHFIFHNNLFKQPNKFLADDKHLKGHGFKLFAKNIKDGIFSRVNPSNSRFDFPQKRSGRQGPKNRFEFPADMDEYPQPRRYRRDYPTRQFDTFFQMIVRDIIVN